MYNKLDSNFHLANKKALFMNMHNYYKKLSFDPFEVAIPLTYHIKTTNDQEFSRFIKFFRKQQHEEKQNVWIIKPGENSNRGCGIEVSDNL